MLSCTANHQGLPFADKYIDRAVGLLKGNNANLARQLHQQGIALVEQIIGVATNAQSQGNIAVKLGNIRCQTVDFTHPRGNAIVGIALKALQTGIEPGKAVGENLRIG